MNNSNSILPLNGQPGTESEIKRRKEHVKNINGFTSEVQN